MHVAIPTPDSDIIYSTLEKLRCFPFQGNLELGWNVNKTGSHLVTIAKDNLGIRCQSWKDPNVQETIGRSIDASNFFALTGKFIPWMLATFPIQSVRGKLEHLKKEADEAIAAPDDILEFADCLMLSVGAAYSAGFSPRMLIDACHRKHLINKERKWPQQTDQLKRDEPVHHLET